MVFKLIIKPAIAGSAIYYSCQNGVWSPDSKTTTELYNKMSKEMEPHLKTIRSKIPIETPSSPNSGELCYTTKHYYNQGVKQTFYFLNHMPCLLGQWTKKGIDTVKGGLEQLNKE